MITLAPSLPSPRCPPCRRWPPRRAARSPFSSRRRCPACTRVLQSRPLRLLAACAAHILPPPRLELRIDVNQPPQSIEAELEALHGRLHTPGDALHQCTRLPSPFPDLVLHHREADGEHYLYVEDPARARLAGYTVFNRLIEVDRRTDRHVRAPHSKYARRLPGPRHRHRHL